MNVAKKSDWKTKPFPTSIIELPFEKEFSQKEMEQLSAGLIPRGMEDKWFIYYDNDTLHFHRSWSGFLLYQLAFLHNDTGSKIARAIFNRDPSQYNQPDDAYDIQLLHYLIDNLLLRKDVSFPVPASVPTDKQAAYQHAITGNVTTPGNTA